MSEHKCPSCGARVYSTDDVCMDCGTSLRGPQAAPPPPPPAEETSPARAPRAQTQSGLMMTVRVDEERPPIEVPFPDQIMAEPAVMSEFVRFLENPEKKWAIQPHAEALTVILLGRGWQWPESDAWHSRFQQARYFPDSWRGNARSCGASSPSSATLKIPMWTSSCSGYGCSRGMCGR